MPDPIPVSPDAWMNGTDDGLPADPAPDPVTGGDPVPSPPDDTNSVEATPWERRTVTSTQQRLIQQANDAARAMQKAGDRGPAYNPNPRPLNPTPGWWYWRNLERQQEQQRAQRAQSAATQYGPDAAVREWAAQRAEQLRQQPDPPLQPAAAPIISVYALERATVLQKQFGLSQQLAGIIATGLYAPQLQAINRMHTPTGV